MHLLSLAVDFTNNLPFLRRQFTFTKSQLICVFDPRVTLDDSQNIPGRLHERRPADAKASAAGGKSHRLSFRFPSVGGSTPSPANVPRLPGVVGCQHRLQSRSVHVVIVIEMAPPSEAQHSSATSQARRKLQQWGLGASKLDVHNNRIISIICNKYTNSQKEVLM